MFGRITAFLYGVVCYLVFEGIPSYTQLVFSGTSQFRSQSIFRSRSCRSFMRWQLIPHCWDYLPTAQCHGAAMLQARVDQNRAP